MAHRAHPTPLRRVSVGSLAGLARSGGFPHGPTGLEFLEPPLTDLADDAEQLHANIEGLNRYSGACFYGFESVVTGPGFFGARDACF